MHDNVSNWWSGVSLRTKITGVTVLLLTLGLLVAGVGTMTVLRSYLVAAADEKIKSTAAGITEVTTTKDTATCQQNGGPNNYYFAAINADGVILCSNNSAPEDTPALGSMPLAAAISTDGGAYTAWDSAHRSEWRVVAVPKQVSNSTEYVTLVVGINLDETDRFIGQYVAVFFGFGISVIILGAALTRLLVTSTFTPLREVEATAAAIAEGDFSQRLPGATPNTEVGRLNRSLNTMLNRIDRAFADRARTIDQMRRFVGDASHELRTPLVSVRGYAELYRMGALQKPEDVAQAMERIEKEAIRMGELVSDLLELARIDEAKPPQLAPLDLVPIARDAALDAMASAPDREVRVIVEDWAEKLDASELEAMVGTPGDESEPSPATGPIRFAGTQLSRFRRRTVRGDASLAATTGPAQSDSVEMPAVVFAEENKIRQVVTNLIGNAMRFTPAGSPIELVISVDPVRRVGILDIVDHGEGIPIQVRDKIFQRFWRADSSRTRETGGSGLGLAIVSGIIASHQGDVRVLETPGGGATFRVSLPLLPEVFSVHNFPSPG
jgi:two-component system OmpR family sensor kinase